MIDRLFSLVLTSSLLAGGTLAIGSELLASRASAGPAATIAELPRVVVTGKKRPATVELARAQSLEGAGKFVQ